MTIEELKERGIITADEYDMEHARELVEAGFKIGKRLAEVFDSLDRSMWNKHIMILRDDEGKIIMELYPSYFTERKKVSPAKMSAGQLANKILRHPDWDGGDYNYLIKCGKDFLVDLYESAFDDYGVPYRGDDLP